MTNEGFDKDFHKHHAMRYNGRMTDENMLSFPNQLASHEEMEDCYDIDVRSFQTRMWATKLVTAIQNGQLEPTESVIQNLKNLNASLKEWGKSEINLDFLK